MAQKTDLNVAPYYDDFDTTDNFHRVLFRPGFAVQARELTQLQSILQNQIERHGQTYSKMVQLLYQAKYLFQMRILQYNLHLQFGGEDVVVAQYLNTTTPVTITGATSGVKAQVLVLKQELQQHNLDFIFNISQSGTDNETTTFSNSENISSRCFSNTYHNLRNKCCICNHSYLCISNRCICKSWEWCLLY